ncbi:kinesin-like protein KIN-8A [Microtus oregoni]|uniref:kinesin-like protein KIN-8A n=1 Tax=Microtus oregoni TaxID=111838 RepID=UPI001BB28486|nr:kinesin-like protein KIN-8A [Microtus oregoni]
MEDSLTGMLSSPTLSQYSNKVGGSARKGRLRRHETWWPGPPLSVLAGGCGVRPCQAHTWAGLSGAVERVERGEEAHPPSQDWPRLGSSAHVGRWLALGRERGGAARTSSRPPSSGLVEAQRAPPPRAEPGLQPGGTWGGRGSLWLLCPGLGLFAGRRPGMLPPGRCGGGMANVQVAVRVWPLSKREAKEGGRIIVEVEDKVAKIRNLKVNSRPERSGDTREKVVAFGFDYCYWSVNPEDPQYASQEVVFQDLGTEVLSGAAQGYNICLFAYGQTGSGKTYTMLGTPASVGLTPRICEALFIREDDCASLPSSRSIKVSCCKRTLGPRQLEGPYCEQH